MGRQIPTYTTIATLAEDDLLIVSQDVDGTTKTVNAKNVVTGVDLGTVISTDADNLVVKGTDDNLLVDGGNIAITGGAIDGTPIGATTTAAGAFTTVDYDEIAEPATPASGQGRVYASSNALFFKDDAGTVTNLTASGGGAWDLISEVNMDGTFDEIDITSVMGGYSVLRVTFINLTASGTSRPYMQVSNDGGSTFLNTSGDYTRVEIQQTSNSTSQTRDSNESRDVIGLSAGNTSDLGGSISTQAIISGLASGFSTNVRFNCATVDDSTPFLNDSHGSYCVNDTNIVDGIRFYNPFAVNWATGGKFILEGILA